MLMEEYEQIDSEMHANVDAGSQHWRSKQSKGSYIMRITSPVTQSEYKIWQFFSFTKT